MEQVILVDSHDNETGTMEKIAAHKEGKLHRAFSIIIFNSKGEMLLQKRAAGKYHSAGLWTNACCSHPRPQESTEEAVSRRLYEEIGLTARPQYLYKFIYKTQFDNGLIEHELDHVYLHRSDIPPVLNPQEADDWKYMDMIALRKDIATSPDDYTFWFRLIVESILYKGICT